MSKHIVFLIHGVGHHPKGWSDAVIDQIDELAAQYNSMDGALSDQLSFVEIAYGDIFDDQLDRWTEDFQALKDSALNPQVVDALSWLDGANNGSFVWDSVGDVLLFLSRTTRMTAVTSVMKQMAKTLSKEIGGDTQFSIVAHSLGTAVAMEAVSGLATPAPDIGWPGLPPKFLFTEVFMIANTSRLLQRQDLQAYTTSALLPKKYRPTGRCATYRNYYHRLDPIPWVRRFDLQTPDVNGYRVFALDHYYHPDLHGIDHYLIHPAVHGPLMRLADVANLSLKDLSAAVDEFHAAKRFGGDFEKVAEVEQFISDVASVTKPHPESEQDLVGQMKYIRDVLKEML
jgi:hypothetical protein